MAIRKYVSRGYNNYNKSASVLNKPVGSSYIPTQVKEEEEEQNAFGFLGGLGYLGEKLAVGAVSSIEGISDYTFSGLAKLFGNDAWAEDIIKNDWFGDWYSHPEEWFNPDQGWQVAGDVAGGIGSSLPSMAAAIGATVATGGLAAPAAAAIVGGASFLTSGLGAAGRATKEAYEQTGKLTGKEYGYGALVGATEGGVEALGNLLSLGSGAVVKSVSKAIGKETAEAFAKQGILKTLGESFAGEAFEEGFSEWITPYWQRATYDPKAKDASADEILYASLVGGLSGVVMGGSGYAIDNVKSFAKGNKLTISGGDTQVLATAGDFASFEELNQTGDELFLDIANKRKSLLESLSKTNGKAVTIQQKRDLGALERANIAGSMKLFVATRAQNIINNAPLIAERLTAFGYKTADGKPIRFTAEEITTGYDPKKPSSIYKALQTNSKLRELAVADATGRLMMDTNQFKKNALMGQKLASQVDINRFYEQASREELQAVTDALKIDSWSELTPETFNQKITDFINDGGVQRTLEAKERKAAFASLTQEGAQNVPKIVNLGKDGMRRYTDGQLDIAVERKGDKYTLYNYKTDNLSKEMKREEINKFLRDYSNQKEEYLAAERERLEVEQKRRAEFEGIETMLRDNVSEYKTLNAPSQSMIRKLVREGRAKGVSDSDLLMYAKVSAHSGIDIQFDKEANYRGVKKDGSADYADGFYEAAKNRIVVNPEGKRTAERLLIHELDHAITKDFGKNRTKVLDMYKTAIKNTDKQLQEDIAENYAKDKILYETKARYAEQVLGNKYTLEKLIEAEPSLKDKILSFFKGASTDYADTPSLSGAAKKYYRTYKKLFDEFSTRNAQSNANEKTLTSMNQENMQISDEDKAHITAEMPEEKRADIIEKQEISPVTIQISNLDNSIDWKALEENRKSIVAKPLIKKLREFGYLKTYKTEAIDIEFDFTASGLRKSMNSQVYDYGGTLGDLAKVVTNMQKLLDNSVLLEIHKDKAKGTPKENRQLMQTYVLLSAFAENNKISPVQFEIKQYVDDANRLYLAVALTKIETGVMDDTIIENNQSSTRLLPVSKYSIPQLIKKINPKDENFFKYIPNRLLTDEQKIAKQRALNKEARKYGYDENSSGKDFALDIDSEGENISGAEVMSWLNKKPESDGTLNLEETVARGLPYKRGKSSLTVGEIRKVIANTTHEKVYSKGEALKVVNKLSGTWGLTVKARDEIADTVWQFLNEAPDVEYRQDMAHDIAEYIVAKVLMDSKTENPDALEAAERLAHLRTGIGKLSFTDRDIAELRHAVDEKGLKRLMGRWGFKGTKKTEGVSGGYVASRRIPMDVFVTDVAREMPGMEHLEEMHPAEAFLEIDKAYSRAYADSKDKWISSYWDMPDSEIPSMVKDVENGIMSAFEFMGEKSKFKKLLDERIERYEKRAERFKAERDEIKGRDRILGLLMNQASKMKNLKMGTYANATQHDSDVLRGSVERLARIQFRGNLNVSGTRQIISELRLWYNPKNSMLEYVDEQNPGYYSRGISDMLDALADGEGGFDKTDLMMLHDVMAYFTNFVENYGKVWRKGQWVDADVEAKRYVNTLQSNSELKVSVVNKLIGSRYMQTFGDPMTVARRMDMHESGFFTEMLEELREGAMGAQVAEMEILSDYDKFLTENRKYIEKTATERIVYQGVEVPKMQLIGLYMTLKRRHSRPGLAQNGFAFFDTDGKKVRVNGFALDVKDITEAEIDKRSEEQIALIDSKLTDTDRQYIKILEKAYNEDARRLKAERDIQRLGFTNAGMGYYYPIRRGNIAKNVDSSEYMAELDRVSNSSFNKNTVKGARQELYIENADVVFRRHIKAVTKYSYLSPAIEAYNKLYNLDIGGNPNHPISVATESANTWDKGNEYFKKLIADIQGIPAVSGEGAEILSKIRGGYAKYQLGANPKVWFTQLSSLFASTSRLDPDSIVKAAGVSTEGLDKYCPLAKLRNSENTAAIAQAVLDTRAKRAASGISRISDALMAPIGKMDRFVVGRLFAACQVQVEKNGGAKVGTEQNKIAAGELLTKVILETQQNSIATERSAAMRSGNEIVRTMTMFTSDSMKVTGRVIDAYGESLTLKARISAESDATKRAALEKRLEGANKKVKKSLGAMVGSAVYMACVAQLFRWLYNKEEDEDKTVFETMFFDTLGNMLGGLPLIKDVYTKLFEGYDISNYSYSAINDLIDSAGGVFDLASKAISGDLTAEVRNREIRNLAYSVGQLTGMPTRNVYNVLYGLTKRFSPTAAFVVDSWFYKKNYQNELSKAIERGDNKTASYILSVIMGERFDENIDEQVFSEILSLTASGYKVLPKLMPESITMGDVEYPLSDGEIEAMQKIYSGAENAMKALITSKYYGSMTNDEKAIAIDYISDLYYDKARNEVLGIEADKGVKLLRAISAEKLAAYYVKTRGMQSDVDDNGNTISGSKRAKVVKAIGALGVSVEERLLLICASGYTLKDGDIRGVSAEAAKKRLLKYILNLRGLSADERAEIAVMCGFEVKNGRIVNNFSSNLKRLSKNSSKGK